MIMNKIILGIALLSIVGFCNVDAKAETFEPNSRYDQAQSIDSGTYQIDGSGHDWFSIQSTPGINTANDDSC